MSGLRICLFGNVRITHRDLGCDLKVSRVMQALLAYLLLYRDRPHPREKLVGLFWADHDEARARACLSTTLWRLRRVLEPEGIRQGTYLWCSSTGEVSFNRESDCWLDVAVFEESINPFLNRSVDELKMAVVSHVENALRLYVGELLEAFYDDWALRERERLQSLYINSLAHLMRYYKYNRCYEKSLQCGEKILQYDPLREAVHREMMRLYVESGQRGMAIRQYQLCRETLAAELGIPPMEETQSLCAEILKAARSSTVGGSDKLEQVLPRLDSALRSFEEGSRHLSESINIIRATHPGTTRGIRSRRDQKDFRRSSERKPD